MDGCVRVGLSFSMALHGMALVLLGWDTLLVGLLESVLCLAGGFVWIALHIRRMVFLRYYISALPVRAGVEWLAG